MQRIDGFVEQFEGFFINGRHQSTPRACRHDWPADHTVLFHLFDNGRRPVIANPEMTLDKDVEALPSRATIATAWS